mgnify:CR=1 FL=1
MGWSNRVGAALAATFCVLAVPAHASLTICNRSSQGVFVAIAYDERDTWVSAGWWRIEPNACTTVRGTLDNRYYYVRAEGDQGRVWQGDYEFCTADGRFTISNVGNCGSGVQAFYEVNVGDFASFTSNLTE